MSVSVMKTVRDAVCLGGGIAVLLTVIWDVSTKPKQPPAEDWLSVKFERYKAVENEKHKLEGELEEAGCTIKFVMFQDPELRCKAIAEKAK